MRQIHSHKIKFYQKFDALKARKNTTVYWNFLKKYRTIFNFALYYNSYATTLSIIPSKILHHRYSNLLKNLYEDNVKLYNKTPHLFIFYKKQRFVFYMKYLTFYGNFFFQTYTDIFFLGKQFFKAINKYRFYLNFSFFKTRLFINLINYKNHNLFFSSGGFFIKFFDKKKSLKKNKTIKLLMVKFLRKILIISRIKNFFLLVKKTPKHLTELLNLFQSPIAHKFTDPFTGKWVDDSRNPSNLAVPYLIFISNTDFTTNKARKKGRVKRKILRKIVLKNQLVD